MSSVGTKEEWEAYLERFRKHNAWEEQHRAEYVLPFDEALEWLSNFRATLSPETIAYAEKRDATGFSELLKTLALIRV
jgi:hypothetical protein